MRPLKVLCLATMLGVASGCWRRSSTVPLPARGPVRDSLIQLDLSRGDTLKARGAIDGTLALVRADIVYLRAGVPTIYGREALRLVMAAARPPANSAFLWQPLGAEVSADRRSAYTYGVAALSTPQSSPALRLDRYIAFWQRDPPLPWRIVAYAEIGGAAVELPLSPELTTPPVQSSTGRVADFLTRLRSTDSAFSDLADRTGVADAFAAYAAPEGAVFAGPELVVGPRALHDYYAAQSAGTSLTWTPMFAGGALSQDLGFTVGNYVATGRGPSGAAVQRFGKYLTVWKRQRDGSWLFVIDGGSLNPARATSTGTR